MTHTLRLAICCLFLFSSLCYAQSKMELGVRFIAQSTTLRYDLEIPGLSPLLNFIKLSPYYVRVRSAQGIGIVYNPVQKLRFGADLLYSLQGGGYQERKTNLNYLTFPLWIGFNSKAHRRVILTMQTGIQLSCLMSAKNIYSDGHSVKISHYVIPLNWGIPVAVGIKCKVAKIYLVTTQLYLYSDFSTVSQTNSKFGAYNYVYPGLRISIDQNWASFKNKR